MIPARSAPRRVVAMTVQPDGVMTVTVDGLRLLPVAGAWARESYAEVVDHATVDRSIAAVVEVREADGTVFRELVPAARTIPVPPRSLETVGVGFLPGEQVAVAPIALQLAAAADGTVADRIALPASGLEPVEVVLLGQTSGTIHVAVLS